MNASYFEKITIVFLLLFILSILGGSAIEASDRGFGDRGLKRESTREKHKDKNRYTNSKPKDHLAYARKQAAKNQRKHERTINQMVERSYYQALERDYNYKYSKRKNSW